MLRSKLSLLIVCSMLVTVPAHATGMVAGATWPEQIIQEITLIQQYSAQAQQLQEQFQMVSNQARNLQSIPVQMWPNISSQLTSLVNLVGNAQGLSYGAQNTLAQVSTQYGQPGSILPGYDQQLQNWTGNLNNQIGSVLQQYSLQAQGFQNTQQALQQIQSASQSAAGRMQVLQAGNQISGLMVNQLQGLQSTIMAGNQAELNYLGNKANREQQDRNHVQDFIKPPQANY
ncbi:MAG: P-type conjugative transfer protein TrbJ [Burkholderiales bacterium]